MNKFPSGRADALCANIRNRKEIYTKYKLYRFLHDEIVHDPAAADVRTLFVPI